MNTRRVLETADAWISALNKQDLEMLYFMIHTELRERDVVDGTAARQESNL